ncbi:MAG: hypothetical protein VB855_05540, partial [Pirellulaceae bacterium]
VGRDGIQVGAAIEGMLIHNNVIRRYALGVEYGHTGGIQLNPGSVGRVFGNHIESVSGSTAIDAIAFAGGEDGPTYLYNNLIVGAGTGLMALSRMGNADSPVHFLNNTVVHSGDAGSVTLLLFCSPSWDDSETWVQDFSVKNNIFTNYEYVGSYIFTDGEGGAWTKFVGNDQSGNCPINGVAYGNDLDENQKIEGNLYAQDPTQVGFVDFAGGDYRLDATSTAVGSGENLGDIFTEDIEGYDRGDGAFDMGAYKTCTNNDGSAPTCGDINECLTDNGGCGDATFYTCTNNDGAAPTCTDIDECLTDNGGCGDATFYTCTNNDGSAPTCGDTLDTLLECVVAEGGCHEVLAPNASNEIFLEGSDHAGQTVCIPSGSYANLSFTGLRGAEGSPVTITNCGAGQVVVDAAELSAALTAHGSRYLHFTGTGDPTQEFGFLLMNPGAGRSVIDMADGVSDIEIEYFEVAGPAYAGIAIRNYPYCNADLGRDVFTQHNTFIHHNYVHDVSGEGLYIGPSHYHYDYSPTSDESCAPGIPEAALRGVEVHHNTVENVGRDGIQVGAAIEGMSIHNNVIRRYAVGGEYGHTGGIQLNPGSVGRVFGNHIES